MIHNAFFRHTVFRHLCCPGFNNNLTNLATEKGVRILNPIKISDQSLCRLIRVLIIINDHIPQFLRPLIR